MRILLTSPGGPAEGGAAQLAMRLRDALQARGTEAVFWEPPISPHVRLGSRLWRRRSLDLEDFARRHGPFDAIDVLPVLATPALARLAPLIVRSVQPELSYLAHNLRSGLARPGPSFALSAIDTPFLAWRVVRGLHAGSAILCLTDSEVEDWARRFPPLKQRLHRYRVAPSAEEQQELRAISLRRSPPSTGPIRLLWIGRWARHKGTHRLAAYTRQHLARHPENSLTIAGCGTAGDEDLRKLSRLAQVRLLPSFTRPELPDLLAAHDVGLFTSLAEGWGLSLNEMLESGMPVYATEAGGAPELRRYFPSQLRSFPPGEEITLGPLDDTSANGYRHEFRWDSIADRYRNTVQATIGSRVA